MAMESIVKTIKSHRCYSHPIFDHWADNAPPTEVIGALFHQIRHFCDATRPGLNLPEGLKKIGLSAGSALLEEIVESEENHGPELATMAGHILNRSAGHIVCPDLYDQEAVESKLKEYSDRILGSLPGYHRDSGLMPQTRRAKAVFERRMLMDEESIYKNLGTTLALEMVSNRMLIPGEKRCLVDSGLYSATIDEPEMHYLLEHYGETGAEAKHEQNAIDALASVLTPETEPLIQAGALDFLNSLAALWDLLDAALLESGASRASA
jgi:hypothetical protein